MKSLLEKSSKVKLGPFGKRAREPDPARSMLRRSDLAAYIRIGFEYSGLRGLGGLRRAQSQSKMLMIGSCFET
jgi:hypothetical protein